MKSYNLILSLAAVFVAAGAYATSVLLTPPHYINVRYCNQANFVCSTVNACIPTSSNIICKVSVQGFLATGFDIKVNATTCSTPVFYPSVAAITKPGTICEVR